MIDKVRTELAMMGLSRRHIGFEYLAETIVLVANHPPISLDREIFPIIAMRHNTGIDNVRSTIRYAIRYACIPYHEGKDPTTMHIAKEVICNLRKKGDIQWKISSSPK